jgi:hypothetical protein
MAQGDRERFRRGFAFDTAFGTTPAGLPGWRRRWPLIVALVGSLAATLVVTLTLVGASAAHANGVAMNNGDVLAAVGDGLVKEFSPSGTLLDTLDTGTAATYTTGMCFDSSHNLFVTDFSSDISEFNSGGNLVASTWVSSYPASAESCTMNASNDVFVGSPGEPDVLEYSPSGTLLNTFPVAVDSGGTAGTDWVDLGADQCTLYYTDEGSIIKRFNVCTDTQLPDFATGLPAPCFELRVRPNGEVIVACQSEAVRLSSAGAVLQTYAIPSVGELFSMNLDPDGTTFWTGDDSDGNVFHVNIATGAVLSQFNSSPSTGLYGLAIVGGIVVSQPSLTLAPSTQSVAVGTPGTVTATLDVGGLPASGKTVLFKISGANSGSGSGTTNAGGQATFQYTGTHGGLDTITACYDANANGTCDPGEVTATATINWTGSTTGCTMTSTSNSTAFLSGSQSIHIENGLSSNTATVEHVVLRSLNGAAQFFTLATAAAVACHDNASYGLGSGTTFNTLTLDGTGSYGTSLATASTGYSIHIEIGDWGDSGATDKTVGADKISSFVVTKTSSGTVVWSGNGYLTAGSEEEAG